MRRDEATAEGVTEHEQLEDGDRDLSLSVAVYGLAPQLHSTKVEEEVEGAKWVKEGGIRGSGYAR